MCGEASGLQALTQSGHRAGRLRGRVGQRRQEAGADGTQHRIRSGAGHRRQSRSDSSEIGCMRRAGGAEGADGVGVGEHAVRTAAATVRFH